MLGIHIFVTQNEITEDFSWVVTFWRNSSSCSGRVASRQVLHAKPQYVIPELFLRRIKKLIRQGIADFTQKRIRLAFALSNIVAGQLVNQPSPQIDQLIRDLFGDYNNGLAALRGM